MNGFIDDLKNTFNKPGNMLPQLIIINVGVFVILGILMVFSYFSGLNIFNLVYNQLAIPAEFSQFIMKPWTIITYAFVHSMGDIFHILFNMLFLYWFGRLIVEYLGSNKLLGLYIWGAITGAVIYLLAYNFMPVFRDISQVRMVGASAAVYAVMVGAATLLPDFRFFLLFLGPVKIKYIALFSIVLSFIGTAGSNAGGNIAHLGGAFIGYVIIIQLKQGNDWTKPVVSTVEGIKNLFRPKPKIKVSHSSGKRTSTSSRGSSGTSSTKVDQHEIDRILDKISERGYESLSKEEKEKLFNASRK